MAGNVAASSPGQVLEILGGASTPPLQTNGSESNTNTITMGELWDILNAGGITATSRLCFGFALNETGPVGSNWVMITELDMSFERPGGGRGFGFTGAHFHKNWAHDDFRKTVLNAIVWTANIEVPKNGVPSKTPTQEELDANQDEPKPKR